MPAYQRWRVNKLLLNRGLHVMVNLSRVKIPPLPLIIEWCLRMLGIRHQAIQVLHIPDTCLLKRYRCWNVSHDW